MRKAIPCLVVEQLSLMQHFSLFCALSSRRVLPPGLASSCFAWIFGNFKYIIFFYKYEYPFHNLFINDILQHCANQLKQVLIRVISMYVSGLFWAIQDKARRGKGEDKSRQDKASSCDSQARHEMCPLVLKKSVSISVVGDGTICIESHQPGTASACCFMRRVGRRCQIRVMY